MKLPEFIPCRFNRKGMPNGWMPLKDANGEELAKAAAVAPEGYSDKFPAIGGLAGLYRIFRERGGLPGDNVCEVLNRR